ncbi:MAG: glutamate--tRNA ligase family protein, partial [Patescibacteria group bacterium]
CSVQRLSPAVLALLDVVLVDHRPVLGQRHLARRDEPRVVRLNVPHERLITFEDEIRGTVRFRGHTVDDQVLLKGDGFPTYHLAHAVDDHLMGIDMVVRGEEWLSSLPKHLLLFEFLGWKPPAYAHVPLLLNKDRTKLSKRELKTPSGAEGSAVAVEEYIHKGYLPEALVNFLALLGWNPGTTQEIFSLPELTAAFSLNRVQKGGAVFDTGKLDWLQGQWMRKIPLEEFAERTRPIVAEKFPDAANDKTFGKKAALIRERITFFAEAPEMLGFFYAEPEVTVELLANEKQKVTKEILPHAFEAIEETLKDIPAQEWTHERLLAAFQEKAKGGEWKLGQLLWPLRVALTGRAYSPGATEVAAAIAEERGADAVLMRVRRALAIARL